jgi:hypothetical protein
MSTGPNLQEWNFQSVAVMQAMLGMLSQNFRRVTLSHDGSQWLVDFVLEREDAEDREEIEDFETEWDALQSGPVRREVRTIVESGPLSLSVWPTRGLYQRREAVAQRD